MLKSFINSGRILRTELLPDLQKIPCTSINIKNNCGLLAVQLFEFEICQKGGGGGIYLHSNVDEGSSVWGKVTSERKVWISSDEEVQLFISECFYSNLSTNHQLFFVQITPNTQIYLSTVWIHSWPWILWNSPGSLQTFVSLLCNMGLMFFLLEINTYDCTSS